AGTDFRQRSSICRNQQRRTSGRREVLKGIIDVLEDILTEQITVGEKTPPRDFFGVLRKTFIQPTFFLLASAHAHMFHEVDHVLELVRERQTRAVPYLLRRVRTT